MAGLLNAIAPSRPAAHTSALEVGPTAKPDADVGRRIAAVSGVRPTNGLTGVPSRPYDIADALADVLQAISSKAAVAPQQAVPTSAEGVAPSAASVPDKAIAPTVPVVPEAAKATVVPITVRASKAAATPVVAADNDWRPIASAPFDRNVQVGVTSRNGILAIFFPCRRMNAGWINAIVKAPLLHEPACWREWREDYFEAS
ncbi:MAG TPA: hypothetical protein VK281_13365 [Xanthobacteraceae bacterium]|nr:hypothetical protein [Xanthobacteraceae bacterium]